VGTRRAVVLLVEQDPDMTDRIGSWLESAGHEVVACPGPSFPDYTCLADRGRPCPLSSVADIVVLDLWLSSDRVLMGTSSSRLLSHYLSTGKRVVALSSRRDERRMERLRLESSVVFLEWPPDRRELLESVGAMLRAVDAP
jgi:DNA-binding response OmpR family regulator